MATQRRPRFAGRGRRQPTGWTRSIATGSQVVAAGTKVLIATANLDPTGISRTVRRTRGVFTISSDQEAAQEEQIGAFGIIVINSVALTAGVASIPGPITEASDDGWFVWQPFGQLGAVTVSGANARPTPNYWYEYDSKAMRKVEEGFGLAFVVENAHATFGLRMWDAFSMLTSIS